MHVSTVVGLILALASSTLISLAYLREHGAAAGLPALSLKRPLRSAKLLFSSREWLVGFAMETCGFGLYVAALALAELALVQSVAAGGVGILAVASARLCHRPPTRRERGGGAHPPTRRARPALPPTRGEQGTAPGARRGRAPWGRWAP